MASGAASRKQGALATAKVIPVLLFLVVVFVSYVVVGPLGIAYLIDPPAHVNSQFSVGVALIVVWFVLLLPVAITWIRLCLVVMLDPGYTPQTDYQWPNDGPPPPGLEDFYNRDVFVCDSKGLPIWCPHCHNWKPDRAHHNQDVGRCTLKMDHFCPWVGGVVGERSFKFFLQFLTYSFFLATYGMIVLAYFVHEGRSKVDSRIKIQWFVALGLTAFFVLFTMGMVLNSLYFTFRNVTSIEQIGMGANGTGKMFLAVLLPPAMQGPSNPPPPLSATHRSSPTRSDGEESQRPLTSELDDPSHADYFSKESRPRAGRPQSGFENWKNTVTYPLNLPVDRPPLPAPAFRVFAILETSPGTNPWDLGSPWRNFVAVFGSKFYDWFLPIRHSPCIDHSSLVSQYPLGPHFEQLLHDCGLVQMAEHGTWQPDGSAMTRTRRKKRRLAPGWQNGERPDGWATENEVRRKRKLMEGRGERHS